MIGLAGARVILVDDNHEEAVPILEAFAKQGIPVAFFDGKIRGLPLKSKRLSGVRLAILDMDLGEGGNDNSLAAALVQRVGGILSPENGPFVVLIWTNRPELRNLFEHYMFEHEEVPNPIFTEMITKAECKVKGVFQFDKITEKIERTLKDFEGLEFFQAWEAACFAAATSVTNSLSILAEGDGANLNAWREHWKTQILRLLYAIAKARAEQQLDSKNCLESAYGALNPIHADKMDSGMEALCTSVRQHRTKIMQAIEGVLPEHKAQVNAMFHLAMRPGKEFVPGNIYVLKDKKRLGWPSNLTDFVRDMINGNTPEQIAQRATEVSNNSHPIMLEISAVCDYAQKKLPVARFLCGLLVPTTLQNWIKPNGSIKKISPVLFESKSVAKGSFAICLSSRHVLSLAMKKVAKLTPSARLRAEPLADIQAWFAYQAGRQGTTLLK